MANVSVRSRELHPFVTPNRVMRSLLSWDPFLRELDGAFDEERSLVSSLPAFDVKETKDAYVFYADLPGFKEEDVQIQVHGQKLTVSGKRVAEERKEGEKLFRSERRHGTFTRVFTLPEAADASKVTAELKNGILTLTVAKKLSEQPRTIAVNAPR